MNIPAHRAAFHRTAAPPAAAEQRPSQPPREAAAADGTGPAFAAYLLLILIEYLAIADELPILKVVRFTTVLSYGLLMFALSRLASAQTLLRTQTKIVLYFIVVTALSVVWAVVKRNAVDSIRPLVDYLALMLITYYFVDRRSRMVGLAATLSLVASVLVIRNLNALGDATRSMHFKASYFMGDGNDFGWGMNMMLPFAVFLAVSRQRLGLRLIGAAGVILCLMGVIGTSSRGGTIGLAAAGLFAWLFVSRRRVLGALALAFGVGVVVLVAPSGYFTRMQSVTQYEEDNSAQIRLQAWTAAIQMAADYPFGVGGGNFGSAYGRFYRPAEGQGRIGYGANRWVAAHSIYFKVLGEYGVPGLLMLLALILSNLRANAASGRALRAAGTSSPIAASWPGFLNMSLVGTAASGAFLGGFDYPHLFVISGLTMATTSMVESLAKEPASAPAGVSDARVALHPVMRPVPVAASGRPARPVEPGARRVPPGPSPFFD